MIRKRRVLVVGSGGREHALGWALSHAPSVAEVIVAPGNAGTSAAATTSAAPLRSAPLPSLEPDAVVSLARREAVDLCVVGPEGPLCAGAVDALAAAGIEAFGPTARAARLEGSKAFLKRFASRQGIPTAPYRIFTDEGQARRYVQQAAGPLVVKADGLCGGKGAVVTDSAEQARRAIHDMMAERRFGEAGQTVIVEDRLVGRELSIHAICDGSRWLLLPVCRDHKRVGDGDTGPNTGGMGAFAPVNVEAPLLERIEREVVRPTIEGMAAEGTPFRGVLYAGLMITPDGRPQLLEHNVRFGDPECQVLMPLFDGDLAELLSSAARGDLASDAVRFADRHAVVVVLAAAGYPEQPRTGAVIDGLSAIERADLPADVRAMAFHAGTSRRDDAVVTAGGRVLGVTAVAAQVDVARRTALGLAEQIVFEGRQYRRDIAATASSDPQE